MSDNTKISWSDATWNPVSGCTEISPGCAHCYAKTFAERWRGIEGHYYENGFDVQLRPSQLEKPLHWKKPRRIFVNSMSDLFHEAVPIGYVADAFGIMLLSRRHTYQLLTKRIERAWEVLSSDDFRRTVVMAAGMRDPERFVYDGVWPPPNVLVGPTIENQHWAEVRLPYVAQLKAQGWRTMVSYEPALQFVNFGLPVCDHDSTSTTDEHDDDVFECERCGCLRRAIEDPNGDHHITSFQGGGRRDYLVRYEYLRAARKSPIDWLICGGESGPRRRPFNHNWAESAKLQAREAGVPFFFKQTGALRSESLEGVPDDLLVREFPTLDRAPTSVVPTHFVEEG